MIQLFVDQDVIEKSMSLRESLLNAANYANQSKNAFSPILPLRPRTSHGKSTTS
jgi:hypothetical protein